MCTEVWEALDEDEDMSVGLDELMFLCHKHHVGRQKHARFLNKERAVVPDGPRSRPASGQRA